MGMALLLVLLLMYLLARENDSRPALPNTLVFKSLVAVGLVLTLIQIGMGSQVRQFVDDQMHYWGLDAASKWLAEAPFLFYFHRSFSLLVLAVHGLLFYKLWQNKYLPPVFLSILLLIGLEILTGIWMYYFDFPFSSQPLHLVFASLLFGAQSYFMIRLIRQE